jgi:predicted nicotinamide N-methyase
MTGGLEAELRARYEVREERYAHGGWKASLILPSAADELIDEGEFASDERLPYWAELWPSARGLAAHLLDEEAGKYAGVRVLELGCGVALPSLALRHLGADVLATDWYGEALRFARANAERNGLAPLRTALMDWRHPLEDDRYDLVVAADVLYEQRNASLLANLLPRVTAPGGTVLVADPGRVYVGDFLGMIQDRGWRAEQVDERVEPSAPNAHSRVRIHRLTPPAPAPT